MRQRTAGRLITAVALYAANPLLVAGADSDLRAEGVSIRPRVERADDQPMPLHSDHVPQHAGPAADLRDDQIEGSIAVDVAARQVPPHTGRATEGGRAR